MQILAIILAVALVAALLALADMFDSIMQGLALFGAIALSLLLVGSMFGYVTWSS